MAGEFDKGKGRIKEAGGALLDDDQLRDEGKVDQLAGKVKDAADRAVDKVKDLGERIVNPDRDRGL